MALILKIKKILIKILVVDAIYLAFNDLGLKVSVDKFKYSIVKTLDPYTDIDLQNNYSLAEANKKYNKYGIEFIKINDHHSGSHCPEGLLGIINSTNNLDSIIKKYLDQYNNINYLNFSKIILDYLDQ